MKNKRITWSCDDYKTEDKSIEGLKASLKEMNDVLGEYEVGFDTYKSQIKKFDEKVKRMLVDCDADSFYFVENRYKAGTDDTTWKTEGVHKTRIGLEDSIEWILDRLWKYGEINEDECMWWEITKYINSDGYKRLYRLYLAADRTLLGLDFENEGLEFLNNNEREVYNEFVKSFSSKKTRTVIFPFEAGDIVKVDYTPYKKESNWLVYSGYKDYFVATGPKQAFYMTKITDYKPIVEFKKFSFPEQQLCKSFSSDDLSMRLISGFLRENPDYFNKEKHRSKSRLHWLYSELVNNSFSFVPELKKETTLDEHKLYYKRFMYHFENYFASKLSEDELYFLCLRNYDDKGQTINDSTFGSFDKMYEYILSERYERKLEEKQYWWQIERKKLVNNEYRTTMTFNVDIDGKPLAANVSKFSEQECEDKIKEIVLKYLPFVKMDDEEYTVILPFEIGDIICVDIFPEKYRDYVIYLGQLEVEKGRIEPACLMYAWRSKGILSVEGLAHLDLKKDKYSLYPFMNISDTIGNSFLSKRHAVILKLHPELANELLKTSKNEYGPRKEFFVGEIDKILNEYY